MRLLHPDVPWIGDQEVNDEELVVGMTRDDLATLASTIGEALEAVEDWEFQTRVGVSKEEARALGSRIGELLRESFRPE
jgi:hypothetical protein